MTVSKSTKLTKKPKHPVKLRHYIMTATTFLGIVLLGVSIPLIFVFVAISVMSRDFDLFAISPLAGVAAGYMLIRLSGAKLRQLWDSVFEMMMWFP